MAAQALLEHGQRGLVLTQATAQDAWEWTLAWAAPRRRVLTLIGTVTALALIVASLAAIEVRTSWIEAHLLARYAREATFRVEPGAAPQIRFPTTGPFDERLGYTRVPTMTGGLAKRGFEITRQARSTADPDRPEFIFPLYHEKTVAGLTVQDPDGHLLYQAHYPRRVYAMYDSIPAVIVRSLVFLENRELLEETGRFRNPAIEWDRLAAASGNLAVGRLIGSGHAFGGSTLATQMEKFRHSPDGLTQSALDKMQQLASASARSYLNGPQTEDTRRRIVTDYVNSVPLGAVPGFGEVIGMADGLYAWFGLDFSEANRLLARADQFQLVSDDEARAFRSALALLVALRRPAFYLAGPQGRAALDREVDIQARLLLREGIISPLLGQTALGVKVALRSHAPDEPAASFVDRKAANLVRTQLLGMLDAPSLPALDRYDVTVRSTVDSAAQQAVTARLQSLRDPVEVRSLGFTNPKMLGQNDPAAVGYSFILYERTPTGNALRVQADNLDVPFDLNRGARLELGSTAKVRTMVTYLEIMDNLHRALATGTLDAPLAAAAVNAGDDSLTRWAIDYHRRHPGHTRQEMLEAALDRRYSASPRERFFTGGGLHQFVNFDRRFDDSLMTVRDALANSVNLVFIRLLGDVVRYHIHRLPDVSPEMLADPTHPARQAYLQRFVESDSRIWLRRFYNRYRGLNPDELLDSLAAVHRLTPIRLAQVVGEGTDRLARIHPLELWTVKYLRAHPAASWDEVAQKSETARRDAYTWLLDNEGRAGQRALETALEEEAFQRIEDAWHRLGYPYDDLVPSLATTIGSSGDRPDALAELMGILVNDGVRMPQLAVDEVRFAEGTPFETAMRWTGQPAEWVVSPEVAAAARGALMGVVTSGTASVLHGALRTVDDRDIPIGGKTGTGQNEYKTFGPGLRVTETRSVNRTATFVFFIGDRFFGTITAHVAGPESARYQFTSALPVKLFGVLLNDLKPMLDDAFEWRSVARGTFSMN
jgi:membrane peptidoglycan carboxypeptidase